MGFDNRIGRWTPDAPQQAFGGAGMQGYGGNTSGIGWQSRQNYGGSPGQSMVQQGNQYIQQGGQSPIGMWSETNPQSSAIAQIIQQLFGGSGGSQQSFQSQNPMGAGLGAGGLGAGFGASTQMAPMAQAIQNTFQPTLGMDAYNAIPWQDDMYYGGV